MKFDIFFFFYFIYFIYLFIFNFCSTQQKPISATAPKLDDALQETETCLDVAALEHVDATPSDHVCDTASWPIRGTLQSPYSLPRRSRRRRSLPLVDRVRHGRALLPLLRASHLRGPRRWPRSRSCPPSEIRAKNALSADPALSPAPCAPPKTSRRHSQPRSHEVE